MRILFVLSEVNSHVPSHHAVGILSAVLKQYGHETSLYLTDRIDLSRYAETVRQFRPAVVALTSVTQQLPYVKQLIAYTRHEFPHITTILGGTHAILERDVIEEIPELDALCVNEGEGPLLDYVAAVQAERLDEPIPNLRIRIGDEIVDSPTQFAMTEQDMTDLPFEDREIFPRWRETQKGTPLESLGIRPRFWFSRGCAYQCAFCSLPTLRQLFPAKKYVRYPSAERCIAEIESVNARWTISRYVIDDDVFSHNPKWIIEEWSKKFPERLKHLKGEMNLRVETVSDELMRVLAATGMDLLKLGVESGDYHVRKDLYHRNITNEQTLEAFALAKKYGMRCRTYNIIGHWDETRGQIWKTIRLNQRLRPDKVQVSLLYPYPGTPIAKQVEALGVPMHHVDSYFEDTPFTLKHLARWELKFYFRFFRLFVYAAYSPRLACKEIVALSKWLRDKLRGQVQRYNLEDTP